MIDREENPSNVASAEIVVGIPSYLEADSIAFVTQQASVGLKKYFPDKTAVIINCDNNSPDGTEHVFLNTPTQIDKIYITTPPHTLGKGYNLENLFRKVLELGSKVLICVDADLTSIAPEWIRYFGEPVYGGFDYVSPVYSRHKYDGTITNTICYPLIYSLFCRNIRQPISGDFAISAKLVEYLLLQPWRENTRKYGIDIFISMNAVTNGYKICKIGLGAKQHKPSGPKLDLMFVQVVDTAFQYVTHNVHLWKDWSDIYDPPLFTCQNPEPHQDLAIDRSAIKKKACEDFSRYKNRLKNVLDDELYSELDRMFSSGSIDITSELWTDLVFEIISAYARSNDRNSLVEAMRGLYFGRILSFMNKTWTLTPEEAEQEIFFQARRFYAKRDNLIRKLEG